ncbi:MAG TPA: type II toxin-antitoxin system VapC family toxin [Acidiphilium sp.]
MIAVDTSALMAILLWEPEAGFCIAALESEADLLISTGTVVEALIVARGRNLGDEMERLIDGLGFQVVSVTEASARQVAQAWRRWGKGVHPAALNFGDCFAYAVAKQHDCKLLYVGKDFGQTDIGGVVSQHRPGA